MIARHDEYCFERSIAGVAKSGKPLSSEAEFRRIASEGGIARYYDYIWWPKRLTLQPYVSDQFVAQVKVRILGGSDFHLSEMNV